MSAKRVSGEYFLFVEHHYRTTENKHLSLPFWDWKNKGQSVREDIDCCIVDYKCKNLKSPSQEQKMPVTMKNFVARPYVPFAARPF